MWGGGGGGRGGGGDASLGKKITKAPVFFQVRRGALENLPLLQLLESFQPWALTPLLSPPQLNSPQSAQAFAKQKPGGGLSSGCLATATSCSATQKHEGCLEHKGLAIFWDGGGNLTRAARSKYKLIDSKNDLASFSSPSRLPAQSRSFWKENYFLLCCPSKRTKSRFLRMSVPLPKAAYQLDRDLPQMSWVLLGGELGSAASGWEGNSPGRYASQAYNFLSQMKPWANLKFGEAVFGLKIAGEEKSIFDKNRSGSRWGDCTFFTISSPICRTFVEYKGKPKGPAQPNFLLCAMSPLPAPPPIPQDHWSPWTHQSFL